MPRRARVCERLPVGVCKCACTHRRTAVRVPSPHVAMSTLAAAPGPGVLLRAVVGVLPADIRRRDGAVGRAALSTPSTRSTRSARTASTTVPLDSTGTGPPALNPRVVHSCGGGAPPVAIAGMGGVLLFVQIAAEHFQPPADPSGFFSCVPMGPRMLTGAAARQRCPSTELGLRWPPPGGLGQAARAVREAP